MSVFQATKTSELVTGDFAYYMDKAASTVDGLEHIREKFNFSNGDVSKHVSLQHFLNYFSEIHTLNPSFVEQIGINFIADYEFPDNVFNFSTALQHLEAFYSIYQFDSEDNMPTGDIVFGIVSRSVNRLVIRSPFPCEFEVGLIKGIANSFNKKIKIEHHDFKCRMDLKSESCDYFIIVLG